MRICRIVLIIVLVSTCNAATFGSALGKSRVRDIVEETIHKVVLNYRYSARLKVSPDYAKFLTNAILGLEAPERKPAIRLGEGLTVFLNNAIEYVTYKYGGKMNGLILIDTETVGPEYIEGLKGKCREEVPCPIPPCCGECRSCQ
jgi:hypothetical protein